jgi:hypothetical protein
MKISLDFESYFPEVPETDMKTSLDFESYFPEVPETDMKISLDFENNFPEIPETDINFLLEENISKKEDLDIYVPSYNTTIKIRGGKDIESTYLIDIFDENGKYINTFTAYESEDNIGYVFENLEATKTYQFQATQIDAFGKLVAISEVSEFLVTDNTNLDILLYSVETKSSTSGIPVFEEVSVSKLNSVTGIAKLNIKISNFDRDGTDNILGTSDDGAIGVVVNDVVQQINLAELTKDPEIDFTYALRNYEVQLVEGVNNIYILTVNPDGSYDLTEYFTTIWTPEDETLYEFKFTLNGCDVKCSPLENSSISIFNSDGDFLATKNTDENGSVKFSNLTTGYYIIQPDYQLFDIYISEEFWLYVDRDGETEGNLSTKSNKIVF